LAVKNLEEIGNPWVRLCANIQLKMLLYCGHRYNNDWSNSLHLIAFRNREMRRKRNKFGVLSLPFSSSPWQSAVLCRLYLRTGSSLATRNFSLLNFHLLNGVFRGKTTTGKWGKMREAVRWIMHEFVSPQKPFKWCRGRDSDYLGACVGVCH